MMAVAQVATVMHLGHELEEEEGEGQGQGERPPPPGVGKGPNESAKFGEVAKNQNFRCTTD